jgi:RHS repeat-associated protein
MAYSNPDTQADAMARSGISTGSDNSSFHRRNQSSNDRFIKQEAFYSALFTEGCGLHRVRFILKKQPLEGGEITVSYKYVVMDLGKEPRTQEFPLPIEEGYLSWVEDMVIAYPLDCTECPGSGGEPGHGAGPGSGSVDWSVPLGLDTMGQSFGVLRMYAENLHVGLDTVDAFEFLPGVAPVDVLSESPSGRRQYTASGVIAQLVPELAGGFSLDFYHSNLAGTPDAEGFATFAASPYLSWRVRMLDTGSADTLRLEIVKDYEGAQKSYIYDENFAPAEGVRHQIFSAADGLRTVEKTYFDVPDEPQQERVKTIIRDQDGVVSSKSEVIYETFDWGKAEIEEVLDPDGTARTKRWDYNFSSWTGILRQTVFLPDGKMLGINPGSRSRSSGRSTSAPRSSGGWDFISSYSLDEGDPGTPEYGDGFAEITRSRADSASEISKTKRLYTVKKHELVEIDGDYFADYKIQEVPYMGSDWFDGSIWYESMWDDPSNLVKLRREFASGPWIGQVVWQKNPDGTVETWEYSSDEVTGVSTVIRESGAPDPADDLIVVSGVRRTTQTGTGGVVLSDISVDIETGLTLAEMIVAQTDDSGRPTHILHFDGSVEVRAYSDCCGDLESVTRHGRTVSYEYDGLGRRTAEIRNGLRFEHDYDGDGRLLRTTRIGSDSSEMVILEQVYNLAGELISRSENGKEPTLFAIDYPGDGTTIRTTTFPGGGTLIETTYPDGSLKSRSGTATPAKHWEYASSGDYYEEDDVVETITEYSNDDEWVRTYRDMTGRILKVEYPPAEDETESAVAEVAYNSFGQETLRVDPDGVQTLSAYDDQGYLTIQALDLDRNAQIDYVGNDRITRTATEYAYRDGIPVQRSTRSRWDTDSVDAETVVSISETSLDGFQTWQTTHGLTTHTLLEPNYDSAGGRRETTTYADETSVVRTFSEGRLTAEISRDVNGQTLARTDYEYDSHGRLFEKTVQGFGTTTYLWNAHDQLESVSTPDPDPVQTGVGYEPQTTTYFYNSAGRVERVDHPDGTSTHTTYWPDGQIRRTWGSRQYPVEYSYTPEGRLDTLTTWQDFNDPASANVTQWHYDAHRGWLLSKEIAASGEPVQWEYTPAGRLKRQINGRGLAATYQYTDGGDLELIDYSDATPNVTRTFDRIGRIETTIDASGQRSHHYQADRPTGETYESGPLAGYAASRSLDALNRLGQVDVRFEDVPLQQSHYTHSPISGRLEAVVANGLSHAYSYAPLTGLPGTRTVSNQAATVLTVEHDWDALGRLRRIATSTPTDDRSFDYRYNDANQRTRMTLADDTYWDYGYDSLGQLTGAVKKTAADLPIPGHTYGFTMDDIGNRIQTVTNGRTATYTPNDLNQYEEREVPGAFDVSGQANAGAVLTVNDAPTTRLGAWFHGVVTGDNSVAAIWDEVTIRGVLAGAGQAGTGAVAETLGTYFVPQTPQVFVHDADGNLTQDGRWSYSWDAENRLIAIETLPAAYNAGAPRQRITFGYDSQGRRFSKTVENWNGSTANWETENQTAFLYDDWNLIAEIETDYSSTQLIERTTYYTWGTDLSGSLQGAGGLGGLLAVHRTGGSTSLPIFDGNGNVMGYYAADTGESTAEFEYGPFGEPIRATGEKKDDFNFRFSTKYEDAETGLLYYGFRYYDPVTGRWPNRDPIEENGGLNLYGFVLNNSIDYFDIHGLRAANQNSSNRNPSAGNPSPRNPSLGTPTVPGRPDPQPMNPPTPRGPGAGVGHGLDLIDTNNPFRDDPTENNTSGGGTSLKSVLDGASSACDSAYRSSGSPPLDCGCCVMQIVGNYERPTTPRRTILNRTGFSDPGFIIGVSSWEMVYVQKPCEDVVPRNLFGSNFLGEFQQITYRTYPK